MLLRDLLASLIALALVSCSAGQAPVQPAEQSPPQDTTPVLVKPNVIKPALPSVTTPQLRAESAVVIDAVTGRILFQKNARTRRAVASTQKLLTALVVSKAGSLNDQVTVQNTDTKVEPSKLYIKAGETYTRRALVKGLLVKSGNDLAKALARDVAGSQAEFAKLMNLTARSLGMNDSHFKNAHGLTEEGQFSTALDIAVLARHVYQNAFFRECMATKEYTWTYPDGRTKQLTNTNKVLTRLPYCTGMKTGTTRASGRCLVSSGVFNGRNVIAVALGSNAAEIWNDSEKMLRWALE